MADLLAYSASTIRPLISFALSGFVSALASSCAIAFEGHVVAVHDGDTLTVLAEHRQVKVRLAEIDAPELGQPHGRAARQSLAEICHQQHANVDEAGRDRYGRALGRVTCAGTDANAEQVRRGMAWVFRRYAPAVSPLYDLESEARAARRGLWTDPEPVPPWEFRRTR